MVYKNNYNKYIACGEISWKYVCMETPVVEFLKKLANAVCKRLFNCSEHFVFLRADYQRCCTKLNTSLND